MGAGRASSNSLNFTKSSVDLGNKQQIQGCYRATNRQWSECQCRGQQWEDAIDVGDKQRTQGCTRDINCPRSGSQCREQQ
jgi:hypothetical protein